MSRIKIFDVDFLDELSCKATNNPRLRQHLNIHDSYQEPCQRLFNAIEPGSYIRPHRHLTDPKSELLVAVRGLMGLVTFDDFGRILNIHALGAARHLSSYVAAVDMPVNIWHTVIALERNSILLEIKAGPFDFLQPKDYPEWAPEEGSDASAAYFAHLRKLLLLKFRNLH